MKLYKAERTIVFDYFLCLKSQPLEEISLYVLGHRLQYGAGLHLGESEQRMHPYTSINSRFKTIFIHHIHCHARMMCSERLMQLF